MLTGISLITISASYLEYRSSERIILDKTKLALEKSIDATIFELSATIAPIQSLARNSADLIGNFKLNDQQMEEILKIMIDLQEGLAGCGFYLDPDAKGITSTKQAFHFYNCLDSVPCQLQVDFDFTEHQLYLKSLKEKRPFLSQPYKRKEYGSDYIYSYVVPILSQKDTSKYLGMGIMDFYLNELHSAVSTTAPTPSGHSLLMSYSGEIYTYFPVEAAKYENIAEFIKAEGSAEHLELWDKIQKGFEGFIYPKDFNNKDAIFISNVEELNAYLLTVIPTKDITKDLIRHFALTTIVSLIAIVFAGVIIQLISIWLTNPIVKLSQAGKKMSNGSFHAEIPEYNSNDEIGELSKTFKNVQGKMQHYVSGFNKTLKEKRAIEQDLKFANRVQLSMLPKQEHVLTTIPNVDLFVKMRPLKGVAGDFYDYFFLDEELLFFIVGDVSGKGIPAALFMVKAVTLIQSEARKDIKPEEIFSKITEELAINNDDSLFVTAICGTLNIMTGELVLCDAGHNPPLFSQEGKEFDFRELKKNVPLGVINKYNYQSCTYQLEPNDSLILYTDGVPEAVNPSDEMYGQKKMLDDLKGLEKKDPKILYNNFKDKFAGYIDTAEATDDITIFIMKYMGPDATLAQFSEQVSQAIAPK